MGLESVITNIRTRGQEDAEATKAEARREADAIVRAAEEKAAAIVARREKEAEAAGEQVRRREVAAAHLEAKKMRLNAEREVLAAIRKNVEERITTLPEAERVKHIKALISRANVPDGRVFVAERDVAAAKAAGIDVAGTFKGLGGVVVESADGTTSENLRYENVLDDVWRANLHEVSVLVTKKGA